MSRTTTRNWASMTQACLTTTPVEDVRDVLGAIGRSLEIVEDLLPLDHRDRVALVGEERLDGTPVHEVGLVFEPVDLGGRRRDAGRVPERPHASEDLLGLRGDDPGELAHAVAHAFDVIELQEPRRVIDGVGDIVERHRQGVNVLAIDRGDECAMQALQDLLCELVAVIFDGIDLVRTLEQRPIGADRSVRAAGPPPESRWPSR